MITRVVSFSLVSMALALTFIVFSKEAELGAVEIEQVQYEHLCNDVAVELQEHVTLGLMRKDEAEAVITRCWRRFA